MAPPFTPLPAPMDFSQTFGAYLIGATGCSVLWGVNCVLLWQYFSFFPNDHILLKLAVIWVGLLDLGFTISSVEPLWYWTIDQWGNIAAVDSVSWGWSALPIIVSLLVTSVQLYFAFRVYALSGRRNMWLPGIIAFLAISEIGWAAATFAKSYGKKPSELGANTTTPYTGWMATSLADDVLITFGMLWYLHKARTGFAPTEKIFNRWSRLALETNLLTAIGACASCFSFKWAPGFVFIAIYFPTARVYFLSLLVAVNSRRDISEEMRAGTSGSGQIASKPRWNTTGVGSQVQPSTPRHPAQEVHILTSVTRQDADDDYNTSMKSGYGPAYNAPLPQKQSLPFDHLESGGHPFAGRVPNRQ